MLVSLDASARAMTLEMGWWSEQDDGWIMDTLSAGLLSCVWGNSIV